MNHRNFNTVLKAKQDDEVLFLLQIDKLKGLWRKFYRNCKKLGEVKFFTPVVPFAQISRLRL